MKKRIQTTCPVVFSLDIFGDRWTLVILRDILFSGKSHFGELLASPENIAKNILSSRLDALIKDGMITKHIDPKNKSAFIYRPTPKSLELLPTFIELMKWGIEHNMYTDKSEPYIEMVLNNPTDLHKQVLQKFKALA